MHDGKMLYLLTQHSAWNRGGYPFLLCDCQRGSVNLEEDHVCKMTAHEEQVVRYEKSRQKWDTKQAQILRRIGRGSSDMTYSK